MSDKAIIIGISGPSSSGKTTLARLLQSVFSPTSTSTSTSGTGLAQTFILHEDDFYLPDNDLLPTPSLETAAESPRWKMKETNIKERIPYKKTLTGKTIQDWDCAEAYNIPLLHDTLAHLRSTGTLPSGLRSIEDLNEKTESGVSPDVIKSLQTHVISRLASSGSASASASTGKTLALLEGILLFSPQTDTSHVLHPLQETLDTRLFLPAAYEDVKRRREARTGYVTAGSGSGSGSGFGSGSGPEALENFWVDPPGYVDDVVWPNYALSHSWLLSESNGESEPAQVVKDVGDGTTVKTDVGLAVPGKGWDMEKVLRWAVDELLRVLV